MICVLLFLMIEIMNKKNKNILVGKNLFKVSKITLRPTFIERYSNVILLTLNRFLPNSWIVLPINYSPPSGKLNSLEPQMINILAFKRK